MTTNKSIDGLTPRRTNATAVSNNTVKPSTNSVKATVSQTKTTTKSPTKSASKHVARKTTAKLKTNRRHSTKIKLTATPATISTAPTPTTATSAASTTDTALPIDTSQSTPLASADDFLKPVQAFNFDDQSGKLVATDENDHNTNSNSTANDEKTNLQGNPSNSTSANNPTENQSDMKQSKKHHKHHKSTKPHKKRKIIAGIIITILIILIGLGVGFVVWGNDIIAKITGGHGNVFDLIFTEETYEPLKTDANGRTNILAFGTSGYNMDGDEGDGTHDGAQLTDSIMVISLNQDTGDIAMLSLPRDLKASPTCTATGKINEVYWCNGGGGDASIETEAAAAQALMDEVGGILGLDFQYFAHLNWGSLVQVVNTLGGINITLDEDILDYYWTGAVFEAGVEYTIDGEQALGLARARHGTTGGDFSRGASQQKILIGIKNKILEKGLGLTEIISLAGTLGDNLRTNFSVSEMKTLAHLASDFDFDNIRQVSLIEPEMLMTNGTINGISYVIPVGGAGYYDYIQEYVAKMFSSDPKVYEDHSILVLNGSDAAGLAAAEQNTLQSLGYQNVYADNAPSENSYVDEFTLYKTSDTAPGVQKLLEDLYHTKAQSVDELPVEISRDYTFILILGGQSDDQ